MGDSPGAVAEIRPLTHSEFERIRALAYQKLGLDLKAGKEQLVSARLGKHLRGMGLHTFHQYCDYVDGDRSGHALTEMIDALTTNYTALLREPAHFEFLRKTALPEFRDAPPIRIWSAACATGEEPYSIAVSAFEESGETAKRDVRVLATDISTKALETAKQAVYPAEKLAGLPQLAAPRYFLRGEGRWKGWFRARSSIREMVEFRRMNLNEPFPSLPKFAVIFCRNVMIYFDRATQSQLVQRLAQCLEAGGYILRELSKAAQPSSDWVAPVE